MGQKCLVPKERPVLVKGQHVPQTCGFCWAFLFDPEPRFWNPCPACALKSSAVSAGGLGGVVNGTSCYLAMGQQENPWGPPFLILFPFAKCFFLVPGIFDLQPCGYGSKKGLSHFACLICLSLEWRLFHETKVFSAKAQGDHSKALESKTTCKNPLKKQLNPGKKAANTIENH